MLLEALLFEMNVANPDDVRKAFEVLMKGSLDNHRHPIPPALYSLLYKRLVKAAMNDDNETFMDRHLITPEQAETTGWIKDAVDSTPWLKNALSRGQEVYFINPHFDLETRINHIIEWAAADPQAGRIIKALPEGNFFLDLTAAADTYFAQRTEAESKPSIDQISEPGREVVMTFRMGSDHKIHMYNEDSLAADPARGPIVSFWAKLNSKDSLNREGQLMGHCVGSYCDRVQSGQLVIYSLRDAENHPHATVELTLSNPPRINQVKGKGNKAPVGKYAPYIRDFLNSVGAKATSTGVDDLRGLGLLTKDGKYGTILDVGGGTILETFPNGDTIRILQEENDQWYVEKSGTIPFQIYITMSGGHIPDWNTRNPQRTVQSITVNREEPGKYSVYGKNLIVYLNKQHYEAVKYEVLSRFGVLFDSIDKKWGTKDELTEDLFTMHDVSVRRLGTNLLLFAGNTLIAEGTLNARTRALFSVKVVEEQKNNPALRNVPEIVRHYYENYYKSSMDVLGDIEKNLLRDMGIFSKDKGSSKSVPESKAVYNSNHGEVRAFSHRLYFYDPKGVFLGSTNVGIGKTVHVGGLGNATVFKIGHISAMGNANLKAIFWIISDLSRKKRRDIYLDLKELSYSDMVPELGFFIQNDEMIPRAEVEFKIKVKGYTIEMSPSKYEVGISITPPGSDAGLIFIGTKDKAVNRVSVSYHEGRNADRAIIAEHRVILAAALNHANVKMEKRYVLANCLTIKNGKFAPQTDQAILDFVVKHKLDLGNKFEMHLHGSFTRKNSDNTDRFDGRFGDIRYMGGDSTYGSPVVYLSWHHKDKTELQYHMRKTRGDDDDGKVSREAIIKASAKFMSFFHDKIEPYLSNQYVGPAAGEAEFPSEDD